MKKLTKDEVTLKASLSFIIPLLIGIILFMMIIISTIIRILRNRDKDKLMYMFGFISISISMFFYNALSWTITTFFIMYFIAIISFDIRKKI